MRDYIYSLMADKRKGFIARLFKTALFIASLFYAMGLLTRMFFYRFGIFKTRTVPMKVISVGNLTLGGTGKTPFVIALAKAVREEFKKEVSVLIRGYGWDEQAILRKNLKEIPLLVGEDRVRSSQRAIKLYGSDTAILDDGFQYWELKRDIDIVLIDSRNPLGNGMLFPRGILREPKDAIRRAAIVVFTKVNKKVFDIDMMKKSLRDIKDDLIFLEAVHKPRYLYNAKTKDAHGLDYINGRRVILISSIGDPEYFEETVKDMGADIITHIKFSDHHNYGSKDVNNIIKICDERSLDFIVTTEKDIVKLNRLGLSLGEYPLLVLFVEMEITSGKELLNARLHSLYSG